MVGRNEKLRVQPQFMCCGPHDFREDCFKFPPIIYAVDEDVFRFYQKSMRAVGLWGVANLDPRGLISRIYVGDHLTL